MSRHTQPIPKCPRCDVLVIRTHTCRAPRLEADRLETMPPDFRDQVAKARRLAQVDAAPTLLDHAGLW